MVTSRPRAARLGVFAVDADAVQIAWGALGPGRVEITVGDDAVEVHADGGPGVVSFRGLTPDTAGTVELTGPGVPGGARSLPFRTLAALPGPERFRFATVSDTHIGSRAHGVFHTFEIPVLGKTGTAEYPAVGAPHAWFAGYTQAHRPDQPDIVIVVMIENVGEGSQFAAPIFKRMAEIYFLGRAYSLLPWESEFTGDPTPTPGP